MKTKKLKLVEVMSNGEQDKINLKVLLVSLLTKQNY